MGRNKKQSLIDKLRILIENDDFEKALFELKRLNNEEFLKSLSPEDAKALMSYFEDLSRILSKKELELKKIIQNTKNIKSAYLR
ncbi:hypothetical protein Dester_1298 [Desulfurobacterium thermolithotrophum DSM 11699]|uniref:Uncharacterized protein n=1 Tax=Desulfurobacterium thermolithotrophum (strain DSM 11699 / BSA) TaxID=868864 RepID=F0S155_DESTD|nr:hypothetical protein [Desulfurobacterium thermolithotrophum]ADY73933.1 hypothetical protein Dester_1298 [Desulfurobacterium thermolithotrophum DSM 11699]